MKDKYIHARPIIMLLYFGQGMFLLVASLLFTNVRQDAMFALGAFWIISFFAIILFNGRVNMTNLAFGLSVLICSCVIGVAGVFIFQTVISVLCLFLVQIPCSIMLMSPRLLRITTIVQVLCVALVGLLNLLGVANYINAIQFASLVGVLIFAGWVSSNHISHTLNSKLLSEEYERSVDSLRLLAEIMCEDARASSLSKTNFLSSMSHEIRTPINSVLGMNEMILRECKDEQILEYAKNVEQSGNMLLAIISDILDFSKIESGKMEIVPVEYELENVVRDLVNMVRRKIENKGLLFILDVNENIPNHLVGDEVRMRQIGVNLLSNAGKYTDDGSVTLKIDYEELSKDRINLIISVIDTGRGIKEEDRKKLFDAFTRVDEMTNRNIEGTGLGLAITNSFVQLMGGEISLESEYKRGSTFSVKIPQRVLKPGVIGDINELLNRAGEVRKYKEIFTTGNVRILVVDDNRMNIMVVKHMLKTTGVKVDAAYSGMDAIEMIRRNCYDMVLLDHFMPVLDGIETLKLIRSDGLAEGVPFIALTANAISGAKEMYIENGFTDYMTKPILGDTLERTLIKWLPKEKINVRIDTDGVK